MATLQSRQVLRWTLLPLLLVGAAVLYYQTAQLQTSTRALAPLQPATPFQPVLTRSLMPPAEALDLEGVEIPVPFKLERGQTLGSILESFGVERASARQLTSTVAERLDLRKLQAGSTYDVYFDAGGDVTGFALSEGRVGRLHLQRAGDDWTSRFQPFVERRVVEVVSGRLQGSLEASLSTAGAPVTLAYRMADVLQWDLDFTRDLRLGDEFSVIYERVYVDGQNRGAGSVLALQYKNRGRVMEAYSFPHSARTAGRSIEAPDVATQGDGGDAYYDSEGRPLRKMFLRSPMRFSRVTSQFSHRRFHPVLKTYRPHYGVDYGAPKGTPVRVTANGTVTFVGWDRGGGKVVKVRHINEYQTAYLHLSGYAPGISRGRSVRQGEVIGYVGSTGLSTGPHLDYRVKHRGRYINPLSMKSVPARPVDQKDLGRFSAWREQLQMSLASGDVSALEGWVPPVDKAPKQAVDGVPPSRSVSSPPVTTAAR